MIFFRAKSHQHLSLQHQLHSVSPRKMTLFPVLCISSHRPPFPSAFSFYGPGGSFPSTPHCPGKEGMVGWLAWGGRDSLLRRSGDGRVEGKKALLRLTATEGKKGWPLSVSLLRVFFLQKNRSLRQRVSRLNCRSPFRGNGKSAYSTMIGWTCRTLAGGGSFSGSRAKDSLPAPYFFPPENKWRGGGDPRSSYSLSSLYPTNQKQRSGELPSFFWSVCSLLPSIFICRYSSDSCVIHGQSRGSILCSLPRPWSPLGPCAERCRTLGMYSALSLCEIWSVLTTSTLLSLPNFKRPKSGQPRSKTYFASPRTWTWPSRSSARLNSLCITLQHYLFLSLRISLQPRCCLRG